MVSDPQVWKGSDHRCIIDPAAHRAQEAEVPCHSVLAAAGVPSGLLSCPLYLGGLANSVDQSIQASGPQPLLMDTPPCIWADSQAGRTKPCLLLPEAWGYEVHNVPPREASLLHQEQGFLALVFVRMFGVCRSLKPHVLAYTGEAHFIM